EVRSKLGKGRQFAVLGQCQTDTTAELFDDLGLGRTTNTRYRDTGVHGRTNAGVEQRGLNEDLAVGNGDLVGRYERGHVTSLGLDHRQGGQRTCLALHFTLGELLDVISAYVGGAFQQTGVQVEHVTRVRFTSRRKTQQQGVMAIRHSLLGQV